MIVVIGLELLMLSIRDPRWARGSGGNTTDEEKNGAKFWIIMCHDDVRTARQALLPVALSKISGAAAAGDRSDNYT